MSPSIRTQPDYRDAKAPLSIIGDPLVARHPLYPRQDEVDPLSSLPPPTLWIFHLPFVQASHSWRPASLNISPVLFIIGLELALFSSSSFLVRVHPRSPAATRARHYYTADSGDLVSHSVFRLARAHAPALQRASYHDALTYMHSHTYAHARRDVPRPPGIYHASFCEGTHRGLPNVRRLPAIWKRARRRGFNCRIVTL